MIERYAAKMEEQVELGSNIRSVEVVGGRPLFGTVSIEGSKVSAVAVIAASVLMDEPLILENVPNILDVHILMRCLSLLGAETEWTPKALSIRCAALASTKSLPAEWMNAVHGVKYLLPALLVRNGYVNLPKLTGGCQIGVRPIVHIAEVLRSFGATVRLGDRLEAHVPPNGLQGARLDLNRRYGRANNKYVSGATKTAILAAVKARGQTTVTGAYTGRPIVDLCRCLCCMGAEIEGVGTGTLRISGRTKLRGTVFRIPFDPVVFGTYAAAAGVTGSSICCANVSLCNEDSDIQAFRRMGLQLECDSGKAVSVSGPPKPKSVNLTTQLVQTDLGPMFAVLLTIAAGKGSLEDIVWERRFRYAAGLRRMGGLNQVRGRTLHIQGVPALRAARVTAYDLRSAAALILAAMAARGSSQILGVDHLRRGYEDLLGRLAGLGAHVAAIEESD